MNDTIKVIWMPRAKALSFIFDPLLKRSYEQWLGFLRSFNLLTQKDSRYFITVAGREFLKYLVAVGKAAPLHG